MVYFACGKQIIEQKLLECKTFNAINQMSCGKHFLKQFLEQTFTVFTQQTSQLTVCSVTARIPKKIIKMRVGSTNEMPNR